MQVMYLVKGSVDKNFKLQFVNSKYKINSSATENVYLPSDEINQLDAALAKEYLQLLVKNIDDSFIVLNKNLEIILLNDAASIKGNDYLNMPVRIGMSILDITKPERHEMLKILYKSVLEGSCFETESSFNKDGKEMYLQNKFRPVYNAQNKIVAALIISVDITEKKHAEQKIKKSEEQYRLLFSNNPLPAWIFDKETLRFLEINKAALDFYGYTKNEFSYISGIERTCICCCT